MSLYQERESHIRQKVKVVLDLSNLAIIKILEHATGVNASDLAANKEFFTVKVEADKLDNIDKWFMFQLVGIIWKQK